MPEPTYDIVAIGNAIVDVLATADAAFLAREGLVKGQMQLIDEARAKSLYAVMGEAQVTSGGSAANTLVGAAMLGARCRMIAQVADDQLGEVFVHDLHVQGIDCPVPPRAPTIETGRCLVEVDPRYFRPTEVDLLIGDPTKAREKLGWSHETGWQDLCKEMVRADLIEVAREPRGNGE